MMQFSEITSDALRLVKASSSSYPIADLTASINRAFERVVGIIREAEGRWQWDDTNQTDFPFATTNIVTDQQDYTLDVNHYRIERVEVKDSAGNWIKLRSIDQADLYDQAITDFLSTSGTPQYYDKVGTSLLLYPAANYSQSDSLKVFYERGPSYFTVSDTTKSPGFNPLYHRLLSMWAGYDYALINLLPISQTLRQEIQVMEDNLRESYAFRDKDEHVTLKARTLNFR